MPQAVADGINGDAAGAFVHGQLVNAALQPLPDEGNGVVGFDFLNENIPHLVVGTVVLDLVDQFVFHGYILSVLSS